jgi:dihydroxyacetone kinase
VTWLGGLVLKCVTRAATALLGAEKALTEADTKVGDGDCGATFARGAAALLLDAPHMCDADSARDIALAIGLTIRRSMGGTSGALYDIFFAAAGVAMRDKDASDPKTWFLGFEAGVAAVKKYGGALPGNRTMLDALIPALEAARLKVAEGRSSSGVEALALAAKAAKEGAEATRSMAAGAGRSSYVPEHVLASVADPGATATATWIAAVADAAAEYL